MGKFSDKLFSWFNADLAMDLGTANTLIYIRDRGIVLDEPSVVAINSNGAVEAVGLEAKKMFGRTHAKLEAIRPMKDGVIADFDITNKMITHFIKKVLKRSFLVKPRIVIGVPTCITQVEKKAVIDAAIMSGVRQVKLVEEPMAAAIGVGIPVHKPEGNMVIDIGGGTTDVAVISLSAIAYGESVRLAGDEIDEAIVRHMRLQHHLNIGVFEGERTKIEVGSAYPLIKKLSVEVKGLNVKTGVPTSIIVGDDEIREAMKEPLSTITSVLLRALEKTPPELSADIHSNGIYLTGGGALIRGLDKMLEEKTTLKVYIPEDPLLSIVKGAGAILDNFEDMKKVCVN
ncbi:MAG: rod shape-determining protein [Candidatus Nitrohelix vancouverensis]|uniref:Cell shape-determining protein MreB n=1 Tax=Candidatus Nitrohelix vancouverensis TaxID=2705534 RepID=A0A7T0C081_9BACT|nr:MAG: rod shape-determining protein [Candidatus Nitrohelix vancouverensis]